MITKRRLPLKIITGLSLLILGLGWLGPLAWAVDIDIYGNLALNYYYKDLSGNNLGTETSGDIFFRGSDEESLLQFLVDLKFDGNLVDTAAPNLYANQYYVIVPITEQSFLYCGKKYKNIGVAKFFRISSRYGYPANLLEYDILSSDSFNYGFIVNTLNADNWNEVQSSVFFDYSHQNFNMQGYYYYEGAERNYLATNLAYQAGAYQFYGEAMWMSQSDLPVITNNSGDLNNDLASQDLKNITKLTAGMMVNLKNLSITLEYYRNNQGLDQAEQDDLNNYLILFPGNRYSLSRIYHYNFSRNYFALQLSLPKLWSNDYSLGALAVASLPDGSTGQDYTGYQSGITLTYNGIQNLGILLGASYRFGGAKGEFLVLNQEKLIYQLGIFYSF